jgi:hypothetical protein
MDVLINLRKPHHTARLKGRVSTSRPFKLQQPKVMKNVMTNTKTKEGALKPFSFASTCLLLVIE